MGEAERGRRGSKLTILLIPGNSKLIHKCTKPKPEDYGQMLTPRRTMTRVGLPKGYIYGIDNECYVLGDKFEPLKYLRALWRIRAAHGAKMCRFATAPDVVADARATLDRFGAWSMVIRELGFPVALVGQDGLECLTCPRDKLDTLFIGGSDGWKLGEAAAWLLLEAKRRGKWTHVGRVNSFYRIDKLRVKPDSIDGTHLTKRPDIYAKKWQSELDSRKFQMGLGLSVPRWGE